MDPFIKYIPPEYCNYQGGYDRITRCVHCSRTALYEDQHLAKPCPDCGYRVLEHGAAKWIKISKWWKLWTNQGYWLHWNPAKNC